MAEEYDYLFKSIVVGDGGVGKTALTLRFSKGFFTEDYKMTIGVDFHVKTISIDSVEGPIRAKLQIWDTGGQERFSSIRPMYYRGSLGALLIFDLTNSSSFVHLPQWIEEVRANVKTEIPLLLVGNKSDLLDQIAVSLEEINTFTRDFNLYYMETSAKTGEGVGDCFYILACLMIGSGVPDQLISKGIVFSPGQVPTTAAKAAPTPMQQIEPEFDFAAPPVPEPETPEINKTVALFEPEPEYEYEAPPVPEPVPEPIIPEPILEPEFEPEIPLPETQNTETSSQPVEFEFKTPEEILSTAATEKPDMSISQPFNIASGENSYKPKAIPFTSNVPIPAPTPEGFQSQSTSPIESSPSSKNTFLPTQQPSEPKSDSLLDYLPEPMYSKKDKKKAEKKKKKEEKEKKLREEKEKQEKLLEEMKSTKKEKKKKPKKEKKQKVETTPEQPAPTPEVSTTPSLFQTLSQKTEPEKASVATFMPFTAKDEPEAQEKSKLRIIPNVSNIESSPEQKQSFQAQQAKSARKEILICKQCGAILSNDYQFCNKCGSKL
ncbi:MAG: GTP-binding protein [Candidatus Thorarchaeota archaeon]